MFELLRTFDPDVNKTYGEKSYPLLTIQSTEVDGENVIATQNIEGQVFYSEENLPFSDRIELTVDGEKWEFTPDPRGKMPAMLKRHLPTPQQEGIWRRAGDKREPESWFAWGESESKHGTTRESKFPTRR